MLIVPPFHPWEQVKDASKAERERMLAEWNAELVRLNPQYFHADGTRKTWRQALLGWFS